MAYPRSEPVYIAGGDDNQVLHTSACIVNGFIVSPSDGQARLQLFNSPNVTGATAANLKLDLIAPASAAIVLANTPMGFTSGCIASMSEKGKVTIFLQRRA